MIASRLPIDLKAKWPYRYRRGKGAKPPQPSLGCGWTAPMTLALFARRIVGEQSNAQAALLPNYSLPPTLLREDRNVRVRVRVGDFAIRVLSSLT